MFVYQRYPEGIGKFMFVTSDLKGGGMKARDGRIFPYMRDWSSEMNHRNPGRGLLGCS